MLGFCQQENRSFYCRSRGCEAGVLLWVMVYYSRQWGECRLTSLVFLRWNTKKSVQIDDMQKIMRDKLKVDPNIPNIEYFVGPSGWFLLWSTFAANIVYWTYPGQPKYIDNTRFHFPIYPFHMILYFDVKTNIACFDNTPESRRSGKEKTISVPARALLLPDE